MASTSAKRTKTFNFDLQDQVGAMAQITGICREGNVDLVGLWGYSMGQGKAQAIAIAKDPRKFEEAFKKAGRKYTTGDACICEGEDKMGVFNDLLQTVSKAGINLQAVDAFGTVGKFCTVLWPVQGQYDKLCKALGC